MKLYHGTSERHLKRILREGLKPRGVGRGNWKHTVDSHPGAVYLTVAYPLYYAMCAKSDGKDGLILEIDSDQLNPFVLHPDEDFLAQATWGKSPTQEAFDSLYESTLSFRDNLGDYQSTWDASIKYLGNCCYMGTIPVSAISRYAIIPNIVSWIRWSDPTISTMNFRVMGDYYKELSARLFGDTTGWNPDDSMSRFYQMPGSEWLSQIKITDLREKAS